VAGGSRPLAAAVVALALAQPAAGQELRVLLFETRSPIQVAGASVAPDGNGLRIDGRRVGKRWVAPGPGPHRAGDQWVRGSVAVERRGAGLRVINRVPLETYVAGTLGSEVYSRWNPDTLRAQAVVTRTYALYQRGRHAAEGFDGGRSGVDLADLVQFERGGQGWATWTVRPGVSRGPLTSTRPVTSSYRPVVTGISACTWPAAVRTA